MSSKTSSRIIVSVIIVFLALAGSFVWCLNQPRLISSVTLFFLKKSNSSIVFKEFSIEKIRWFSWERGKIENLRMKCKIQGRTYFFTTGNIDFDHFWSFIFNGPISASVRNLAVISDSLNISDIQAENKVYFESFRYKRLESSFTATQLEWERYLIENLEVDFNHQHNRTQFNQIQGHFYGGAFQLQGWLEILKGLNYNFNIQLHGVHSELMVEANPAFQQLTASINGEIQVKNEGQGLQIQSHLEAPGGGSIKASLLRYLAHYVPQRQQVEDLIQKNADVPLNKLLGIVTSLDRERIASEVILNSSSLNLNMDVKFNIHIDGGIDGLLEYIHQ